MVENYQELANAIIVQASRDYIENVEILKSLNMIDTAKMNEIQKKKLNRKINAVEDDINEVKKFFRSNWCKMLTRLDPESILKRLESGVGV